VTVLRSGSATDVGRVRSVNQDLALESDNLFAVADGMGGHVGGEVAARVAMEALRAAFSRQPSVEGLQAAFGEANAAVWEESQSQVDLRGMGTTLTALALVAGADGRDLVALANVGDSRAYLYSDRRFMQVTADHSLAEEKVRHGELTEAEAAVHPHRHILTRALGVSSNVEVDLWELHLRSGDRLLLCSDGLSNEVGMAEMTDILGSVADPDQAAQALVRAANEHGGNDNITVVVVDVLVGDEEVGEVSAAAPIVEAGALAAAAAQQGPPPTPEDTGAEEPGTGTARGPGEPAAGPGQGEPGAAPGPAEPATAQAPRDSFVTPVAADGQPSPAEGQGRPGAAGQAHGPEGPSGESLGTAAEAGGPPGAEAELGITTVVAAVGASDLGPSGGGGVSTEAPPQVVVPDVYPDVPEPYLAGEPAAPDRRAKPPKEKRRDRRRRLGVPRRITFRVVGFILLVAAVLAAAYGVVRWYATQNWYVTIQGNHLVVYQGRPGGLLWFKPKVVDRTAVTTDQVLPIRIAALRSDVQEPSLQAAQRYVQNLSGESRAQQQLNTPPTTVANSTATTAAPPATTVPPGGSGAGTTPPAAPPATAAAP
jgi:PPM family protein phosphatase